jgi:hypothetical protein
MKTMLAVLAFAGILIGCSDAGDTTVNPNGNVIARTGKSSYSVGENIAVTLKNDSRSTVYVVHCNSWIGFYIERKESDTWVDAGNVAIICQALYPSGKKDFVSGSVSHDTISLTQAGTYRLRFPIAWLENQRIDDSVLSNEFVVL